MNDHTWPNAAKVSAGVAGNDRGQTLAKPGIWQPQTAFLSVAHLCHTPVAWYTEIGYSACFWLDSPSVASQCRRSRVLLCETDQLMFFRSCRLRKVNTAKSRQSSSVWSHGRENYTPVLQTEEMDAWRGLPQLILPASFLNGRGRNMSENNGCILIYWLAVQFCVYDKDVPRLGS